MRPASLALSGAAQALLRARHSILRAEQKATACLPNAVVFVGSLPSADPLTSEHRSQCDSTLTRPCWGLGAGADPARPERPLPARLAAEAALEAAMVDLSAAARQGAPGLLAALQRAGFAAAGVSGLCCLDQAPACLCACVLCRRPLRT